MNLFLNDKLQESDHYRYGFYNLSLLVLFSKVSEFNISISVPKILIYLCGGGVVQTPSPKNGNTYVSKKRT
jgi:hypothetical protein